MTVLCFSIDCLNSKALQKLNTMDISKDVEPTEICYLQQHVGVHCNNAETLATLEPL